MALYCICTANLPSLMATSSFILWRMWSSWQSITYTDCIPLLLGVIIWIKMWWRCRWIGLYLFRSCWRASCVECVVTYHELVQTRCALNAIILVMPSAIVIDDAYATRFVDDVECADTFSRSGFICNVFWTLDFAVKHVLILSDLCLL